MIFSPSEGVRFEAPQKGSRNSGFCQILIRRVGRQGVKKGAHFGGHFSKKLEGFSSSRNGSNASCCFRQFGWVCSWGNRAGSSILRVGVETKGHCGESDSRDTVRRLEHVERQLRALSKCGARRAQKLSPGSWAAWGQLAAPPIKPRLAIQ